MNGHLKKIPASAVLFLLVLCSISGCISQSGGDGVAGYPDVRLQIFTEEFPPYNYMGPEEAVLGSSTEVVREILGRLRRDDPIDLLPWSEGYQRTLNSPDTVLYSTARTAEREPLFLWVGPIGSYDFVFYARNGSGISIESLEAAKKAGTIGVARDNARHQFLQENNVQDLALYPDDVSCVRALIDGDIALWLGSSDIAPGIVEKAGYVYADVEAVYPVKTVELFIAFNNQTSAELVAAWQETLDAMKKDGTYDAIMARYFGSTETTAGPSGDMAVGGDFALSALMALTDLRLSGTARTLEVLALTGEVQSGEWERIRPLLVELEQGKRAARFWYARPDGSYYTTVDNLTTGNLLDRPYFPGVLAGNTSVGTVVVSHSTGRTTAIVAVPVKAGDSVTGVLGASVYSEELSRDLSEALPLPGDMFFFALDGAGMYVLNSEEQRIGQDPVRQGTPPVAQAFGSLMEQDSGEIRYVSEGKTHTVLFDQSPLTGWRFGVGEVS